MRKLLTIIALLLAHSVSAQFLHIFRNDGNFNTLNLADVVEIIHEPDGINIDRLGVLPFSMIDSLAFRDYDIPLLRITFPDYPTASTVWSKDDFVDATLSVDSRGFADDFNIDDLTLKVKGRGNSTWGLEKKPLRFKFESRTSICGFREAKNYVLLANYLDNTLMRNSVALWLADRLGVRCANHFLPVDIEINGYPQGSYLLTEKIGINKASVDIDEKQGVLLELGIEFDEKYKFRSSMDKLPVMVKAPDFDELYAKDPEGMTPEERLAMWESDFNHAAEEACEGRGADVFDIDSFVRYYLLYNLTLNGEIGYPKSGFLYKEHPGADTPYVFGPAWDFDVAFNFPSYASEGTQETDPEGTLWSNGLMKDVMQSEGFRQAYEALLREYAEDIFPDLLRFIDSYAAMIEPSAKRDALCWNYTGAVGSWAWRISAFDTAANVARLKAWIEARTAYLTDGLNNGDKAL